MTFGVQDYRNWLEKQKIKKEDLEGRIQITKADIATKKAEEVDLVKARWVISEVARLTQERFKTYVEDLVTMTIRSVLDQPLKFLVDFKIKRNKSECYLTVQDRNNEPYIPKDEQGGILVDLISFALRLVLWSLQKPRSRNVFVLDEPFHYIGKGEPLNKAGEMLKVISRPPPEGLGVQFIVVTHEPELSRIADRAWEIWHNGIQSEVKQLAPEIWANQIRGSNAPRIRKELEL